MWQVFTFAMILCAAQQTEHTSAIFSLCTVLFIMISAVAFNLSGGLTRPSGSFIFSYAVVGAIIGLVYKAFTGEPGQKNLLQPDRTIEVFLAGSVAMLTAALLARRFAVKKSFLERLPVDRSMSKTALICLIIGLADQFYLFIGSASSAGAAIRVFALLLGNFLSLAILFGVTATIRQSGGKRSVNLTVLIAGATIFLSGIIGFSKQGMYTPFVVWILAAAAQRYKVSILQVAGLIVSLFLINYYLVPYSQYGRPFRAEEPSLSSDFKLSISLLANLETVRETYLRRGNEEIADSLRNYYYDHPSGIFDRLQMIAPDDNLIDLTENGSVFGYLPILYEFENIIPHVIWKGKPEANFGNIYAHEVGIVADEDTTTGISFSPTGDAYHQGKWIAILLVLPPMLAFLFWSSDAIAGDLRNSPLAVGYLVGFLHAAPEGGVGAIIALSTTGQVLTIVIYLMIAYAIQPLSQMLLDSSNTALYPHPSQDESIAATDAAPAARMMDSAPALSTRYRWSRGRQGA